MKVSDALVEVSRLFLDSAPVIYFVEQNPQYIAILDDIFDRIRAGQVIATTGPITLAECLVVPYRLALAGLQRDFFDLVVHGRHTVFATLDEAAARDAAVLRAQYNLTLPDALQVASAVRTGCEALLTNDGGLRRVAEVRVLVLDDLEP